jgi:peptidase E
LLPDLGRRAGANGFEEVLWTVAAALDSRTACAIRSRGVTAEVPTILATSIGLTSGNRGPLDLRPGPIFRLAAELARSTGAPRLCFVATASGDSPTYLLSAYAAFATSDVRVSHLSLFPMPNVDDVRKHLMQQDVIWVSGGSVANLVAVWRTHGLDRILYECWQAGVVLGGCSAGSLCWHVGGTTDSFGPKLRPFVDGLGWLPYANGVHHDTEVLRRPLLHRLVEDAVLPTAYATDDGVGLVYRGTQMVEVVTEVDGKTAYVISRGSDGRAHEARLDARRLH